MSAVHLHNSIYTREKVQGRQSLPPHSRNQSTLSNVTVQTNLTVHSQPTEPLLPQSRETYDDDSDRTSRAEFVSPVLQDHPWVSREPATDENTFVDSGKHNQWKPARRKASKRWHWAKIGLETILGSWAIYNAVRYFLSFTVFDSDAGQAVSLALGISAGLSFAFLACAIALSLFQPRLLLHGISYRSISVIYWSLTYISLALLFAPAAINFALIFVWKDTEELELRVKYRCYVDVDVVWSRRDELCKGKAATWGLWVIVSTLRLVITALVILAYHFIHAKLRRIAPVRSKSLRNKHRHNPSDVMSYHSGVNVVGGVGRQQLGVGGASGMRFTGTSTVMTSSASQVDLDPRHLQSNASLLSSRTGVCPRGLRLSRSQSSGFSTEGLTVFHLQPLHDGTTNTTGIASASGSQHTLYASPTSNLNAPTGIALAGGAQAQGQPKQLASVPEGEGDLGSFSDRFTSLVSQIHRETDNALAFARSDGDGASSHYTVESPLSASPEHEHEPCWTSDEDDYGVEDTVRFADGADNAIRRRLPNSDSDEEEGDEDDFYGSSTRAPVLGYNEFGQPYPADQQVQMLNGYVRRMPTIESMGSREMGSSIAASSLLARDGENPRHSFQTGKSYSRPPTRNTLVSMLSGSEGTSPSEPSSRHNSLTVQVERLAALGYLTNGSPSAAHKNANRNSGNGGHDITEIGELIDTMRDVKKVPPPDSPSNLNIPELLWDAESLLQNTRDNGYLASTNGSRSTEMSYYSATSRSGDAVVTSAPVVPVEDEKNVLPPAHRFF